MKGLDVIAKRVVVLEFVVEGPVPVHEKRPEPEVWLPEPAVCWHDANT